MKMRFNAAQQPLMNLSGKLAWYLFIYALFCFFFCCGWNRTAARTKLDSHTSVAGNRRNNVRFRSDSELVTGCPFAAGLLSGDLSGGCRIRRRYQFSRRDWAQRGRCQCHRDDIHAGGSYVPSARTQLLAVGYFADGRYGEQTCCRLPSDAYVSLHPLMNNELLNYYSQ